MPDERRGVSAAVFRRTVNTVTDQEMLFEVIHGDGPDTCLDRLLAIAKRQGAPDNVTAVLMQKQ